MEIFIFSIYYSNLDKPIKIEEWINEEEYRTSPNSPKEGYGFQIFLRRKDAICQASTSGNEVVRRVRWRKPVARGFSSQDNLPTVVAKEIFVEE